MLDVKSVRSPIRFFEFLLNGIIYRANLDENFIIPEIDIAVLIFVFFGYPLPEQVSQKLIFDFILTGTFQL